MRQVFFFLKQIPELPCERLASQTDCVAGEPIPPQSPRHYSHRPKIFFASTTVAFVVVDPGLGGGFLPLPCIPRNENVIRFAVQYVFLVLHLFLTVIGRRWGGGESRGLGRERGRRTARWVIFVIRDSTLRWWQSAAWLRQCKSCWRRDSLDAIGMCPVAVRMRVFGFETGCLQGIRTIIMGQDSSVDITTRYRMDGPGIESRKGCEIFRTPFRPAAGAYSASCTMGTLSLSRGV